MTSQLHPRPFHSGSGNLYFRNLPTEFSLCTNLQYDCCIIKFSMTSWPHPRSAPSLSIETFYIVIYNEISLHTNFPPDANILKFLGDGTASRMVAYVCLCSCRVSELVFMLRTCGCVHVSYVRMC